MLYDRFSGFYGINYINPKTAEILRRVEAARESADMESNFCPEYLLSLLAAQIQTVLLVCVPVSPDNQGSTRDEEAVNNLISYYSQQMFRTELGEPLRAHLNRPETAANLAQYYPRDHVHAVRGLMLKSD